MCYEVTTPGYLSAVIFWGCDRLASRAKILTQTQPFKEYPQEADPEESFEEDLSEEDSSKEDPMEDNEPLLAHTTSAPPTQPTPTIHALIDQP
ncbi:hypothetical protein Tco_1037751 [Tanacetum coccineum]